MANRHSGRWPAAGPARDPLFALLLGNGLWGGLLGLLFVGGVLVFDLGHLGRLITFSGDGLIALGLLTLGSVVTFASVAMGGAIMMIGRKEAGGGKGRPEGRPEPRAAVPALVPASRARRKDAAVR